MLSVSCGTLKVASLFSKVQQKDSEEGFQSISSDSIVTIEKDELRLDMCCDLLVVMRFVCLFICLFVINGEK